MKKSIERKILENMPVMSLLNLQEKDIAKIFNLPKSTVSLILTDKLRNRGVDSIKNVFVENEMDIEIKHHWIGSKEREYFINQLKK